MTDSFKSDLRKDWPDKVGYWWFYGYRYGKSDYYKFKPELIFCECKKTSDGIMVLGNGQVFYKSEAEEPNFIPATTPELIDI
jgi:hypothetical protein